MKTIGDLRIEKTVYTKYKNENGVVTEIPETKLVPRQLETVEKRVRFGYFLIDLVFIYILALIILTILLRTGVTEKLDDPVVSGILAMPIIVTYYLILELTTGSTIGKIIIGYTVIDKYAEKPKMLAMLGRNLIRAIPFEAFSCFGNQAWHDKWSDTYVVRKTEKAELKRLLNGN